MGVAEIIIGVLIGISVLNLILQAFYCRVMRYIDQKGRQRNTDKEETLNGKKEIETVQKKTIKIFIHGMLDHYFYGLMRYSVIKCGKIPSHFIRYILYKYVFVMDITKNTVINGGCEFRSPWNIKADRCIIMSNCILDGRSMIIIGEDVVFGQGVHIWTEEHDVNDPYFRVNPQNRGAVIIGEHAWICSDSTILPHITIGKGVVVASRACVTKDCEEFGIYAGVPAKKIGLRSNDLRYILSGKPHWDFY